MRSNAKIWKYWLKVFLLTLLVLYIVRCFLLEPYSISSKEMETSLFRGDRVLVNKMAYGIRLPMTPLTIPFTFDNFFGRKSYSTAIKVPYKRIWGSDVHRNDIVVFNNPQEKENPIDKRSLLVSRCVGIAGDSISVNGSEFIINGKQYVASPNLLMKYSYPLDSLEYLNKSMKKMQIQARDIIKDSSNIYLSLNRYESYLLNTDLRDSLILVEDDIFDYQLIIPARDLSIELSSLNIPLYKDIIADELEGNLEVKDGTLYTNGVELRHYQFKQNYYWFLSDNVIDAFDSRYVGFISEEYILGKASLIWYSSEAGRTRWDRIFSRIY